MARVTDLFRGGGRSPAAPVEAARALRSAAMPVDLDDACSLEPLIAAMSRKRFVLLGEATHGTHEFYELRASISLRLIREHGFAGIVAEADWPDMQRVNRYLRGAGADPDARHALRSFERFPLWMWRNTVILDLVEHLRAHNDGLRPGARKAGIWGMDLYSLSASIVAVLEYLDEADPAAAAEARERYACFEPFGGDPQAYGAATAAVDYERPFDCEDEVISQLLDLHRRRAALTAGPRKEPEADEAFFLRRAERAPGGGRGALLPDDVPRRGQHLEPARHAYGRHAGRPVGPPKSRRRR